jgi:hypothetical protein
VSAVPAEAARDQSFVSVATAFAANATIAAAKGIAAALTGSPALLAETLHTLADTGNEVLLFVALRRSRRVPDATHPLGYGPERYYWALLAAVGMFVIGGTLSIWEGVNALINPLPLEAFWVGVAVLVIALTLDSVSRAVALRQLRAQAAQRGVTVRELLRRARTPRSSPSTWRTRSTSSEQRLRSSRWCCTGPRGRPSTWDRERCSWPLTSGWPRT